MATMTTPAVTTTVDLSVQSVRDLNSALHKAREGSWHVTRPDGAHNLAVGLDAPLDVRIDGHAGYYCAGMNQHATVTVHGNTGVGTAENMMSGTVRVRGNASQSAGATAHGGLLVVEGDAAARCGISMKGVDIVVGGSVGHMSAFMGQAGRLLVCGDAGDALGDSLYEARIYVRGRVKSLGADCVEKEMRGEHLEDVRELLTAAAFTDIDPSEFRRYGSARALYHFDVDNSSAY
ncbi:protein glxC [Streptomyces spiroverticillatus]|uniref:Protein glxC n=1 Tax=Streptomyces finlayi TaxID=67296 RepID=A0A918WZ21_9ACTN|nr:glutamate synthase [Streptomyces finlayi]GHA14253.1 protein glxC [Streptomyces spiroverticillatus]GHC97423.1 protein glxC [Streptomyces finlayi]